MRIFTWEYLCRCGARLAPASRCRRTRQARAAADLPPAPVSRSQWRRQNGLDKQASLPICSLPEVDARRHTLPEPPARGKPPNNRPRPWPCQDPMKTIDEMLNLDLLTAEQHQQIGAWIATADSAEDILKMPAALWQAVERASEAMGIDEDLLRPPALDAGP